MSVSWFRIPCRTNTNPAPWPQYQTSSKTWKIILDINNNAVILTDKPTKLNPQQQYAISNKGITQDVRVIHTLEPM